MSENALTSMRRLFLDRYDEMKARLTKRLGSADLAGDAMQDTWLRLARTESIGVVQSPHGYLFRIALNVAHDHRRTEARRPVSAVEIESLLELPDEAPTPEQIMLARSDLAALKTFLSELPERRREIFLAARVGNIPGQEIADRLGVSRQIVVKELGLAIEHCVKRLKEFRD
jgi:RNA polymerase sigma-70 factor (ECF subfamily)